MYRRLPYDQPSLAESNHHWRKSLPEPTRKGPTTTYFQQHCPACGRRLLILVEYLEKQVACSHCRHSFVARDNSQPHGHAVEAGGSIMDRADRLLALLDTPR